MKIDKDELKSALHIATKFVEKRSHMPILACVMIDGEAGKMYATDLESACVLPLTITDVEKVTVDPHKEAREDFAAELGDLKVAQLRSIAEDYEIEIPSKGKSSAIVDAIVNGSSLVKSAEVGSRVVLVAESLKRIVDSLDETGMIELNCQPGKVSVGKHFHEIYTMPDDEYPIPFILEKIIGTASVGRGDLESVLPATTKSDVGFKLSGVYFDRENLKVVGTDGHRLHFAPAEIHVGGTKGFMVDAGFLKKVPNGDLKPEDSIEIEVYGDASGDPGYLKVRSGRNEFISRVMDARFPDYRAVVPKESRNSVRITRKDVMVALKQALVITNHTGAAKLTFNGGIDVSVANSDTGAYERSKVPMRGHVDPPVSIGLNLKYLVDAMPGKGDDDEFTVELTDECHPVLFKRNNFTALVMPMRL